VDPEFTSAIAILAVALLLDTLFGEYPHLLHPVVWIGNTISLSLKAAPQFGWWRQFLFGIVLAVFVPTLAAFTGWAILHLVAPVFDLNIVVSALLFKASFALRELGAAAERVRLPVAQGNLAAARTALRGLCSRDASELDGEALLAATIQSLAENVSDSFVAPILFFAIFGVPGALAYRAINTLDAMIGYRGRFEALGKAAARLDDVANFLPARLTAALLLAAGLLTGRNGRNVAAAWRVFWRDRANTPSPNGGRPMAMMAGLLGVRLEKKGFYALGDSTSPIVPATVNQAWRLIVVTGWLTVGCCVLAWASVNMIVAIIRQESY
jgi:adenosylcobinamide-phosphate synthase